MNYSGLQQYQRSSGSYLSSREVEAMALNFANRQLASASSTQSRRAALATNIKLWSILLNGVQEKNNPLPPVVRDDLIAVGTWAMRYSNESLNSMAPLQPLIDINQDMVDGLTAAPEPKAPAPAVAAQGMQPLGVRSLALMG